VSEHRVCCAADGATGGQQPAAAADGAEPGQAASADANARTAADTEAVAAGSIDEAAGRAGTGSAVVGSEEPAAPPAAAVTEAGDAAVGGAMGPSAAALAAWESVGNMLSDDDHLGAEENRDSVPSALFASSADGSSANSQSSVALSSEGEASDGGSTEQSQRAELPGERSLEELEATLLYEKVLTANDVKSSVALPEVRPAETGAVNAPASTIGPIESGSPISSL